MSIVDYWRPTEIDDLRSQLKYNYARWNRNAILRLGFLLLRKRSFERQRENFRRVVDQNLTLTSRAYLSELELDADPPQADIYCAGSDQIWNTDYHVGGVEPFFLAFAPLRARRFSLSSSFGKPVINEVERRHIDRYLKNFDGVSLREQSGVEIVKDSGVNAIHLVDPTLALDPSIWAQLADDTAVPKNPYLLVYQLHRSHDLAAIVRRVREERDLKPIFIRAYATPQNLLGRTVSNTTTNQFLGLMRSASYIITDSFHGTAFALNFGIPFNSVFPRKYGERLNNILKLTGTVERGQVSSEDVPETSNLETEKVAKILAVERLRVSEYLKTMLTN